MSHSRLTSISLAFASTLTSAALTADDVAVRGGEQTRVPVAIPSVLDQLRSPRAAERHTAERQLLEQGPAILPRLPAESDVSDAAMRDALRRIRLTLEQQAIAIASQPSRVTLDGEHSLSKIVSELQRQTGNAIELASECDGSAQFAVDWEQTPFWTAVQSVTEPASLRIEQHAEPRRIVLSPREDEIHKTATNQSRLLASPGPLLIRVESPPTLSDTHGEAGQLVRLRLGLFAEPRLRPLFLAVRDQDLLLRLGGTAVTPFNPLASREVEFGASGAVTFDYVGRLATEPDGKAWELSGDLTMELVALTSEFRWNRWPEAAGRAIRRGEVSATLDAMTFDAEQHNADVRFTIRYGTGGPAFESHRIATLLPSATVELPNGRRIVSVGSPELTREQDGALGTQYRFMGLPTGLEDSALLLETPASLSRVGINFETTSPPP